MKKILYIDLDGVVVDLHAHVENRYGKQGLENMGDLTDNDDQLFLDPPAIEGAIEIIKQLSKKFDVFFLSTAPWNNVNSWSHKRIWVEKHLGEYAYKRLILSHRKDLLMGDFLIDDRTKNGAGQFKGELIQFGTQPFTDWNVVFEYLNKK